MGTTSGPVPNVTCVRDLSFRLNFQMYVRPFTEAVVPAYLSRGMPSRDINGRKRSPALKSLDDFGWPIFRVAVIPGCAKPATILQHAFTSTPSLGHLSLRHFERRLGRRPDSLAARPRCVARPHQPYRRRHPHRCSSYLTTSGH